MTLLRPAVPADADALATLFTRSRGLLTFLPQLHSAEDDRGFLAGHVLPRLEVTVATNGDGAVVGFLAEAPGWVEHLYVDPRAIGAGIGSALLAAAQSRQPDLQLWCFAENQRARRFYERHGFLAEEETDGASTDERCPDVRYRWRRST